MSLTLGDRTRRFRFLAILSSVVISLGLGACSDYSAPTSCPDGHILIPRGIASPIPPRHIYARNHTAPGIPTTRRVCHHSAAPPTTKARHMYCECESRPAAPPAAGSRRNSTKNRPVP